MSNTLPYSSLLGAPRRPASEVSHPNGRRALIVEDDEVLARANCRNLRRAGFHVVVANDGVAALKLALNEEWDVIVSDIRMPAMSGIEFLRALREHGVDVPVILLTASPDMESATSAVRYGAHQYLTKPTSADTLLAAVHRAATVYSMTKERRSFAPPIVDNSTKRFSLDPALEMVFEDALAQMYVVYQPIVAPGPQVIVAFEALVRSREPSMAMPAALLNAAERLGRMNDVGRAVRGRVAEAMRVTVGEIFVNVHAEELLDEQLYSEDAPLSAFAKRVTLEITERSSLEHIPDIRSRILRLRELGYRVAIDDLGAGYAGLSSFVALEPDVVKIDMSLIHDIDTQPLKQRLVKSMVQVGHDLGLFVVAEGVETAAEQGALVDMGCNYHQGFLYARAAESFPQVTW